MYEPMPGFNRAQAAYEAQEPPYDAECICPVVQECSDCGEQYPEGKIICETEDCYDGIIWVVDRNESHEGAEQKCEIHGWCGGCSSRHCEDCNG